MVSLQKGSHRNLVSILCLGLVFISGTVIAQSLPDFTQLVEDNAPAIVNVNSLRRNDAADESEERSRIEEMLRDFYGDRLPRLPPQLEGRERTSFGSGFIISADGYIVTNHHVIEGADEIKITLNDRREFEAEVIGSDARSDLALLKIDVDDLPQVQFGSSNDVKVGEWVLAIGSPFGLQYSVTAGIVSYIGRSLPSRGLGNYVSYIQTDVAINPGNSGGPLFNLQGEVIGINSQIFTNSGASIGLSFAIPVDVAKNVLEQLRENGTVNRGWMGVSIANVSQELAEAFDLDTPHGALVNQVVEGSPAEEAGFESGDVIVLFNGQEIVTSGDLPYYVGLTAPGTEASVEIIRDGRIRTINMTVGSLPEDNLTLANRPELQLNNLGVEVAELDEETRNQLSLQTGVVVERVLGEVAREAGFREGDILISINGEEIDSVSEFNKVVADLPTNRAFPVLVARGSRQSFFTVRIPD